GIEENKESVRMRLKRKNETILSLHQEENLTKVRRIGPPSSVAARHEFFKQQRQEIILNGRPSNCIGPPIFLYHEVFSKFSSDFNNEKLDLSNGLCAWTNELIETMANEHMNEDSRKNEFINHITKFIDKLLEVKIEDGSSNDGMLLIETACGENGLRIIHEIKNEIGEGGSDPTIQVTLSYSKYWAQEQRNKIRAVCSCPSILLAVAGPWICVLGGIYTSNPVISPLTDLIPMIPSLDEKCYHRLDISKHENIGNPQRFYPYPHEYITDDRTVIFTYEDWLTEDKTKLLFKGRTDGGCEIVIKFTQRYNAKVHHLCAEKNFAPKLFYVSNSSLGGWYMIVMKYIDSETLQTANITREEYNDVLKNIEEVIDTLHTNDIVFGDLRNSNIMIKKVDERLQAMLIDFDWAGIHQKDRYTPRINPEIK
ncbi:17701_t:CDS:2, partial [Funneliformis geosporum]